MAGDVKVTGLNVFPIKSCHAVQVGEIGLDSYGVVEDRRFMLIDGNGRFVSQRKFSKLATVNSKYITDERGTRILLISAPGMNRDLELTPVLSGERMEVSIWEDTVMVVDQGEAAAQWFNDFIGHGGTFIRLVASAERSPSPSVDTLQGHGLFQRIVTNFPSGLMKRLPAMNIALPDAGPVSLISSESLADVNKKLRERKCGDVPLNRFRMNIEISGCSRAFEEDEWLLIKIGTVPFLVYRNAEVSN